MPRKTTCIRTVNYTAFHYVTSVCRGDLKNYLSNFRLNAISLPNLGSCLAPSKVGGSWFSLLVDITAYLFQYIS